MEGPEVRKLAVGPGPKMWPERLGPEREERGEGRTSGQGPDHTVGSLNWTLKAMGATEGV